jgi:hypothetical protein
MIFDSDIVTGLSGGFDLSGIIFKRLLNRVDINKARSKRI